MKKKIIYLLRLFIIASILLPVIVPYIKTQIFQANKEKINVFVYEKIPDKIEKNELQKRLQQFFKKEFIINYLVYGNVKHARVQDFEDLLNKVFFLSALKYFSIMY